MHRLVVIAHSIMVSDDQSLTGRLLGSIRSPRDGRPTVGS